jgi:hypothetical protein
VYFYLTTALQCCPLIKNTFPFDVTVWRKTQSPKWNFLDLYFHQSTIKVQILFLYVKVLQQNPSGQQQHQHNIQDKDNGMTQKLTYKNSGTERAT